MKDQIFNAFNQIHAEEALIEKTLEGMYSYREKKKRRDFFFRRGMAFAVSFAVMLCVGVTGWQTYFTQAFALTVDVNPSIEMGVNRFDQVISLKGYNPEGEKVIASVDVKYKDYTDAVDLLLEEEMEIGYLEKEGQVLVAVACPEKEKAKQIKAQIDISQKETTQQVRVIQPKEEVVVEAQKHDMSFGKYQAYLQIQKIDPKVTVEEAKTMTVQDMTTIIEGGLSSESSTASSEKADKEPASTPQTSTPSVNTDTETAPSTSENAGTNASESTNTNTGTASNSGTNANTSATPNGGTNANTGATPNGGTNANTGATPNSGTNANTGATSNSGTNENAGTTPNDGNSVDSNGSNGSNGSNSNNQTDANTGTSNNNSGNASSDSATDKKTATNTNSGTESGTNKKPAQSADKDNASDKKPVDSSANNSSSNKSPADVPAKTNVVDKGNASTAPGQAEKIKPEKTEN